MSKRNVAIAVLLVLGAIVGRFALVFAEKMDPSRAEAVLARIEIPADWRLAAADVRRSPLLLSHVVRYYLVSGGPDQVAATTGSILTKAGLPLERGGSLNTCTSNHEPPQTTCSFLAQVTQPTMWIGVVVYDRRGAALIADAPWFAASSPDEIVVRFLVDY